MENITNYSMFVRHDFRQSLMNAFADDDVSELRKLLIRSEHSMSNRFLILRYAAADGYVDIVKEIIEHPTIKVNPTLYNNMPLQMAVENEHVEVVKYLLNDSRVDPSEPNYMPFIRADNNQSADILKELILNDNINPLGLLHFAASEGRVLTVRLTLELLDIPTGEDNNYEFATNLIERATGNENVELIQLLIRDKRLVKGLKNVDLFKFPKSEERQNIINMALKKEYAFINTDEDIKMFMSIL